MKRFLGVLLAPIIVWAMWLASLPAQQPRADTAASENSGFAAGLTGAIRGIDGEPLGGIAVYAKEVGKTITTTVFTDEVGDYVFPALEPGPYRMWAQAVGFEVAHATVSLGARRWTSQPFTLTTTADVTPQLSEAEWMAALPVSTREQRRMKEILRVNCGMCHSIASVLQHRYDEEGWLAMVDQMAQYNRPSRRKTVEFHKVELAKYLASVRGPDSPPLEFSILPRPTGDAARVVYTQFDVPLENAPDGLAILNGNDWSLGRGTHRGYLNHDVAVGADGNVWLTAFPPPDRTLYRIDIATGQVTWYAVSAADGQPARSSHGIVVDAAGFVYFTAGNALGRIDPETDTFEFFAPPRQIAGGIGQDLDIAPDGAVWATTRGGAFRFDPATREWQKFTSVNLLDGGTYGVAADRDSNGWWTQFWVNRVGKGDLQTGQSSEVLMRPPWLADREDTRTAEDKAFYESIGALAEGGVNTVPGAMAPRRMGSDKNGDFVYVANFNGENVVRIHSRTLETKYYRLPIEGHPYRVVVDRHHNAWVNTLGDDWLLRLDARTERWAMYQLPVLNCDSRYLVSDHARDEIWIPCARTSQAVRMQFRTAEQIQDLKAGPVPVRPPAAETPSSSPGPRPKAVATDPTVVRGVYDMDVVVQSRLTDDQVSGRQLFYGRCAICHTRPSGPWIDQTTVQQRGEAFVRDKIAQGSPLMPGQQYSLRPGQIDQIVAFLKTRTEADKPQTIPGWW